MKSGNLNFLEPSGPLQACNGSALPLPFTLYGYPVRHNFIGVTYTSFVILIFLYEYPVPSFLCISTLFMNRQYLFRHSTQETRPFLLCSFVLNRTNGPKELFKILAHTLACLYKYELCFVREVCKRSCALGSSYNSEAGKK
jgi:hypothetical protein